MAYRHVAVFELDGEFLGYSVYQEGAHKLQSTHLYSEDDGEDLAKRIVALNESQTLLGAWPDAHDPEVQALVNDPTFEPIEMIKRDVVDDDNSYLVYVKDTDGEDTMEIDEDASVVHYKEAMVPIRPSDFFARTKRACEVVARRRSR